MRKEGNIRWRRGLKSRGLENGAAKCCGDAAEHGAVSETGLASRTAVEAAAGDNNAFSIK